MDLSINGLSAMVNQSTNAATDVATSALQEKLESNFENATDQELLSACKEFEVYFIEQIMKQVEKTLEVGKEKESSYASQVTDYFKEDVMQDIAGKIVEQNEGKQSLSQLLYEQMKRNYPITSSSKEEV